MSVELMLGDCLDILPTLAPQSVDAIICDLPYGQTNCSWDSVIPFAPMWEQVKRLLKPRGVFVTTASQPFTTMLIGSNLEWFKYDWIWDKKVGSNFQLANKMPMRTHEEILVFGEKGINYYPQKTERERPKDYRNCNYDNLGKSKSGMNHFASKNVEQLSTLRTERFPLSVLEYSAQAGECNNVTRLHPTQKPVALYAYLIRTYTNPGDTVLDFVMGSGTTLVAAVKEGRNGIGVELDEHYFAIAQRRIAEAAMQMPLPLEALP